MDTQTAIEHIRQRLSPRRFTHSMNVAKEAVLLAHRVGADPQKAELAGILHDVMKEASDDEMLQILRNSAIINDTVTMNARPLWHAKAGALYCRQVLGVTDPDLLNAISYHTTGRADMSPLEIAVYLADYIGEDRDYDDVDVMRAQTAASITGGMHYALQYTIHDLTNAGKAIHPDTVAAYNQLVLRKDPVL